MRATKLIPTQQNLTFEEKLQALYIPKLEDWRVIGGMIEVLKIMDNNENIINFFLF